MPDKKMTKREAFLLALVLFEDAEPCAENAAAYDVIAHEVEMLNKKRASSKPDPKKAAEQTALMEAIYVVLEDSDEPMRATAIATALSLSVQRVTALLKKMVTTGEVTRNVEGKVVTFTLT